MSRAQYVVLCLTAGVAIVALLESQRVAAALSGLIRGGSPSVRTGAGATA